MRIRSATFGAAPWEPLAASSPHTVAALEAVAEPWSLPGGAPIITAGLEPDGIHLLSRGVVRVFHALARNCQFTVKLLRAPQALGLLEVMRGMRWAASVEAHTPLEGLRRPAGALRAALEQDHPFALAVLRDMATRFEGTIHSCRSMGFDGCEQRLVRVLLEYAEHFGQPGDEGLVIRFPVTRQRLSLEIGAVRRSVDRGLAALVRQKLLSLSPKGWQVIHDVQALRARI
ncbi:MAG: Crp/Fnr family transcriptional regulator, partial [Archangium sp.]